MPDHFSSSLGLFLALSFSLPPFFAFSLYARRIENNSATDGRRHARPCPTRLRIHFICARGEWIKINDGWTFIAFRGEGGIGEESHKLQSETCVSYWTRLADSFDSDWHTVQKNEDNEVSGIIRHLTSWVSEQVWTIALGSWNSFCHCTQHHCVWNAITFDDYTLPSFMPRFQPQYLRLPNYQLQYYFVFTSLCLRSDF